MGAHILNLVREHADRHALHTLLLVLAIGIAMATFYWAGTRFCQWYADEAGKVIVSLLRLAG